MTQEQKAILDILEDCKLVCYELSPSFWYSAVQSISPICIDRIKMLWWMKVNEEI